ncbi:hypothetical protein QYE76_057220 [Lolium multiflorum]|uniref:DUF4283 domain-containing protein n=1 Tax=Lolium multiflorum TaxID=4521 RepID=A0AAD8T330_LOLMU|nr:hypothetical protein QYE76_057220 [Lolium multiflorum]
MASSGGSNPSGSKGGKAMDVASLLRDLQIGEEEFDDLIIEEEVSIDEEPELLVVARVLTDKSFSAASFEETMRFAWGLAKKVEFRDVGDNTFIMQLNCLGDWKKVVEEGPWLFRNWGIVIQGYDGYSKPSTLILDKLPIWIQIHDIPEAYLKKKEILENLAGRVGKFINVDTVGASGGNFVRVRVELYVNKPLARFTSTIRRGAREVYLVKYEKVPKFCEICGILGHEFLKCGKGFHKEEDHKFGEWMIADTLAPTVGHEVALLEFIFGRASSTSTARTMSALVGIYNMDFINDNLLARTASSRERPHHRFGDIRVYLGTVLCDASRRCW